MPVRLPIDSALIRDLEQSLNLGPMIGLTGHRMLNEEQVARFDGLSIQIQADGPPPHFHVRGGGENISFAIDDGRRLKGAKGLERCDRNIEKWWRDNRCVPILTWNGLRPADCPVGTVPVPLDCQSLKEDIDA